MRFPERGRGNRVGDVLPAAYRSSRDDLQISAATIESLHGMTPSRMAATNLASRGVGGDLPPAGMFLGKDGPQPVRTSSLMGLEVTQQGAVEQLMVWTHPQP